MLDYHPYTSDYTWPWNRTIHHAIVDSDLAFHYALTTIFAILDSKILALCLPSMATIRVHFHPGHQAISLGSGLESCYTQYIHQGYLDPISTIQSPMTTQICTRLIHDMNHSIWFFGIFPTAPSQYRNIFRPQYNSERWKASPSMTKRTEKQVDLKRREIMNQYQRSDVRVTRVATFLAMCQLHLFRTFSLDCVCGFWPWFSLDNPPTVKPDPWPSMTNSDHVSLHSMSNKSAKTSKKSHQALQSPLGFSA